MTEQAKKEGSAKWNPVIMKVLVNVLLSESNGRFSNMSYDKTGSPNGTLMGPVHESISGRALSGHVCFVLTRCADLEQRFLTEFNWNFSFHFIKK